MASVQLFLCLVALFAAGNCQDTDSATSTACPEDEIVNCFADPCSVTSCPAFPAAQCVSDFCGGCNAKFSLSGIPLSTEQCAQPAKTKMTASSGKTCLANGKVIQEGELIRVFSWNNCVINVCRDGNAVEIRGDCVDSYGRCHSHNTYWRQGCKVYLCWVNTTTDTNGGSTKKYQPVKVQDNCPKQ